MEAYYYVPISEKENIVTCGMKLSETAERMVMIDGHPTNCISALLHPKDNMTKYKSNQFTCIRIELKEKFCFVGEKSFAEDPLSHDLYLKSIIPVENYKLGTYRNPECLITCTILPENISLENKTIGYPILYNNSQDLYISSLMETLANQYSNFDEIVLRLFLDDLFEQGKLKKIESQNADIYTNNEGQIYTLKKNYFYM
jgi:hypothetical protein